MNKFFTLLILMLLTGTTACKKIFDTPAYPSPGIQQLRELLTGSGYPRHDRIFQQGLVLMDDDVQDVFEPGRTPQAEQYVLAYTALYSWEPKWLEKLDSSILSSHSKNFNAWARYYENIAALNTVLDKLEQEPLALAEQKQLAGEALGLRAFYYLQLVNLYALPYTPAAAASLGVPLVLHAAYSNTPLPRNTIGEVYAQIKSDIDSSIVLLQELPEPESRYRIGTTAAHFIACRTALYMRNWKSVIRHANAVLERSGSLMQLNGWGAPDPENKSITAAGNIETVWAYGSAEDFLPEGFTQNFTLSTDLVGLFDSGDLRRGIYFVELSDSEKQAKGYSYINAKRSLNRGNLQTGKSLRIAEIYLNRAEAWLELAEENNNPDYASLALADINQLRLHRFAPDRYQPLRMESLSSLVQAYRDERRRELFGEDHRWFDLRRFGMPFMGHHWYGSSSFGGIIFLMMEKDLQYVWSIPESAIRLNPSLQQNPQIVERPAIELYKTGFF